MPIKTELNNAKKILMEYWPLNTFIATNPLWSLRSNSFYDVVSNTQINSLMSANYYYNQYIEKKITNKDLQYAIYNTDKCMLSDTEINQWVKNSLNKTEKIETPLLFSEQIDEYSFQKPIVWIKERIFELLRNYFGNMYFNQLELIDFWYQKNEIKIKEVDHLKSIPIEEAINFLVTRLNIPSIKLSKYLQEIYFNIYGWSSLMHWRNKHPTNPWIPGSDACEIILLMWLSYEYLISIATGLSYRNNKNATSNENLINYFKKRYIWQIAFEKNYFDQLSSILSVNPQKERGPYDAQFIFCIDTRSEGFRRHLENKGNIQTFGFAGFFGAIFNLNDEGTISYQAPALVKAVDNLKIIKNSSIIKKSIANVKNIISFAKKQFATPFALFEIIGFWFLPFMAFKAIQPKLRRYNKKELSKIKNTLSEATQFQSAYNLLTTIGLVKNFSSRIFICAHQSDTINNPYQSALDCGACGGNSGVPNALVMCDILNKQKIREKLKKYSILIPNNTEFIPACHHTVNDRLEILTGSIPHKLQDIIDNAAIELRSEKKKTLPGYGRLSEREKNWSELIPELGLINNASMIIGPRSLTRKQNLERRTFLHSYEPKLDQDGEILATILSAPAIVAHWINSQYYFSTVNPDQFGAGNKAIHNVLPGIGVMEGNLSDLKVGLPLQSTHFQACPIHEPRRIIIVVYAKKEVLNKAIESSPNFKLLLDNKWVNLKHIEVKEDAY